MSCIAVFLWIIWSFIPLKTPKQTPPQNNTTFWGFVILTGECAIILGTTMKLSKTNDSFYYFKFLKPIPTNLDLQHLMY